MHTDFFPSPSILTILLISVFVLWFAYKGVSSERACSWCDVMWPYLFHLWRSAFLLLSRAQWYCGKIWEGILFFSHVSRLGRARLRGIIADDGSCDLLHVKNHSKKHLESWLNFFLWQDIPQPRQVDLMSNEAVCRLRTVVCLPDQFCDELKKRKFLLVLRAWISIMGIVLCKQPPQLRALEQGLMSRAYHLQSR